MKKLIYSSLVCLTALSAYAGWELYSINQVESKIVKAGGNNIYPTLLMPEIGTTSQDGNYIVVVETAYGPLFTTNEFGEIDSYDDVSPILRVHFEQYVTISNGVISLGNKTTNNSISQFCGWYGTPTPSNVRIELMMFTNGIHHQMFGCFVSDGLRELKPEGQVYNIFETP